MRPLLPLDATSSACTHGMAGRFKLVSSFTLGSHGPMTMTSSGPGEGRVSLVASRLTFRTQEQFRLKPMEDCQSHLSKLQLYPSHHCEAYTPSALFLSGVVVFGFRKQQFKPFQRRLQV